MQRHKTSCHDQTQSSAIPQLGGSKITRQTLRHDALTRCVAGWWEKTWASPPGSAVTCGCLGCRPTSNVRRSRAALLLSPQYDCIPPPNPVPLHTVPPPPRPASHETTARLPPSPRLDLPPTHRRIHPHTKSSGIDTTLPHHSLTHHTMAPTSFASAAAGNSANPARVEAGGDW